MSNKRKKTDIEIEDDDGVVLRYSRHPNGGGMVEASARVHHDAWIDASAYVDPGARVHARAHVAAGAWIDRGAVVREGATVGRYAHVGPAAVIGRSTRLHEGVVIRPRVRVADLQSIPTDTVVSPGSSWAAGVGSAA